MMCTKVIAGIIADKIGRRAVFAFGTMGTAIFILSLSLVTHRTISYG